MAGKENCWEYKHCGREPNGPNIEEMGVCPASTDSRGNGIHGGVNAGRCCWAVSHTFCGGETQGSMAGKFGNCMACDFYAHVRQQEGELMLPSKLYEVFD
jgi:hypothetical protein